MPITMTELTSINATPATSNASEPPGSAEPAMLVAITLPTPYARKPARKRNSNNSSGPTLGGCRLNVRVPCC